MVKTVTLTAGTPQAVTFSEAYPFYWVDNKTSGEVYASVGSTPEPGKDGTYTISAGSQLRISGGVGNGGITLLGEGKVQVVASGIAECPFKVAPTNGGGAIVNNESSYTLTNAADYPIIGLNMYGKSTQDGTPTPDAPVDIVSVGDSGSVDVTACGKNLLNATLQTITMNGVTITNNDDGTYTLNGTATDYMNVWFRYNFYVPKGTYKISGINNTNYKRTIQIYRKTTTSDYGSPYIFTDGNNGIGELESGFYNIRLYAAKDEVFDNEVVKPMLTTDLNATYDDFEPYKGNTASITSSMPLCGIPVDSGGNYTDSNGHQWICDELIYNADGSGKIVKRTAKIDSYNGETVSGVYISSTGGLDTGATVIYQIDTPQEIALTAAEMTELMQLQTFDGVTNISNDSGADMDVKYCTNKMLSEYVFPITTGLQKQIDELQAAILSLGGNV